MNNITPINRHSSTTYTGTHGVLSRGEEAKGGGGSVGASSMAPLASRAAFTSSFATDNNAVAVGYAATSSHAASERANMKPKLSEGRKPRLAWTHAEDAALLKIIENHVFDEEQKNHWVQIAAKLNTGRSGKQCRDRWQNHLRPDIKKGGWTIEEENLIKEMYESFGTKWTCMAKLMKHRTDNDIKNKWYSMKRKEKKALEKQKEDPTATSGDTTKETIQTKQKRVSEKPKKSCKTNSGESFQHQDRAKEGLSHANSTLPDQDMAVITDPAISEYYMQPVGRPSVSHGTTLPASTDTIGPSLSAYYNPQLVGEFEPISGHLAGFGNENGIVDTEMQDCIHLSLFGAYPSEPTVLYAPEAGNMPHVHVLPTIHDEPNVLQGVVTVEPTYLPVSFAWGHHSMMHVTNPSVPPGAHKMEVNGMPFARPSQANNADAEPNARILETNDILGGNNGQGAGGISTQFTRASEANTSKKFEDADLKMPPFFVVKSENGMAGNDSRWNALNGESHQSQFLSGPQNTNEKCPTKRVHDANMTDVCGKTHAPAACDKSDYV